MPRLTHRLIVALCLATAPFASHAQLQLSCPVNWNRLDALSAADVDVLLFGVKVRDWKPEYYDIMLRKDDECKSKEHTPDSVKKAERIDIQRRIFPSRDKTFEYRDQNVRRRDVVLRTEQSVENARQQGVEIPLSTGGIALDVATKYKSAIEAAGCICALIEEKAQLISLDVDLPNSTPTIAQETSTARPVQSPSAKLPPPLSSVQVVPETVTTKEAIQIFVGKNYEYFQRKWEIADQKKSKQAWSWAAFLGGFAWMAYRKMYLYSWIFIGVVLIETLCEYAFGFSNKLSTAINFGIAATFGWQGTYWYKLHVEKKVKEIVAMNTPEQAKIEFARQGGTSMGAAIGFVVAFLAMVTLVVAVAEQ